MEIPEKENQEVKRRFQLWVMPSTLELADQYYRSDNCASRSEFIEKAIQFYAGYVSSQQNQEYLARVIPATVKGIVDESSNRMGRLLFKLAVELAVIENILAAVCEVDRQELKRLRGQCVEEIKRTNGMISFEQALRLAERVKKHGPARHEIRLPQGQQDPLPWRLRQVHRHTGGGGIPRGGRATWRTWPPAPGWKNRAAHGLFTSAGEPVVLAQVAGELDKRRGPVWTLIVSLRREDAQRLGYWHRRPLAGFAPLPGHHPGGGAEDPAHPSQMVRRLSQRGAPPSRPLSSPTLPSPARGSSRNRAWTSSDPPWPRRYSARIWSACLRAADRPPG